MSEQGRPVERDPLVAALARYVEAVRSRCGGNAAPASVVHESDNHGDGVPMDTEKTCVTTLV